MAEVLTSNSRIKSINQGLAKGRGLSTRRDRKAGQAGGFLLVYLWTVHKRLYQFNQCNAT